MKQDRTPQPAFDVIVVGDEVDVLQAGAHPAVLRYRLDASGLPRPAARWSLPAGRRPASIARHGADLLITLHERGWQVVPPGRFRAVH